MSINAKKIFQDFNKLKVLIIGDVMIDRYLSGNISRISPEAPVPVVHFSAEENRLGGAANVALNIAALGAQPYLLSVIGKDENGKIFKSLLPKHHLPSDGLLFSKKRQTTTKTRVLAGNQHVLRVDREDTFPLTKKETLQVLAKLDELLNKHTFDIILFQDYNKGVLTKKVIQKTILEAKKRNIPTAADPKKENFWSYKDITLFKPNLKEVREGLGINIQVNKDSLKKAGNQIQKKLNNKFTLITLSEKGLYIDAPLKRAIIPTRPRSIVDVCGAGDTVISVAACGLGLGLEIEYVAHLANLAGGQVCEKVGVVPVNKKQLEKEFIELLK